MRRKNPRKDAWIAGALWLVLPLATSAQLLVVAPDPSGGKTLFEVATASGGYLGSGPDVADCCAVLRGVSSIDETGRRFFFVGDNLADSFKRLYTLDIPTGAVLGSPTITATNEYNFLEWAPVAGELLVAYRNKTTQEWSLATLSPATGALVDISSVPFADCCASWSSGVAALDEGANRLYFVARRSDLVWSLFVIDTANGLVVSSPALSVSGQYQALEYDKSTGDLYLAYKDSGSKGQLATVNPSTGVLSNRGSGITNCCDTPLGSQSALDQSRRRFMMVGRYGGEGDDRVFSLRLSNGTVISDPTLPPTQDPDFMELLPFLFADDFETGNLSRWSSSVP